ncbi:MAG TPA: DUF6088 family protein [Candidatus Hydrogenedentes bacterium]|nr:DUF6088 family protein [Candidatus Hydrogenedentota bacterium]
MTNTIKKIREYIEALPLGQPVTSQEFMEFGSRAAIDQALARLVKAGTLSRVTRGVYIRPKKSPYAGEVPPEPIKVAEAIAAETGSVIQIHGAEAARRMGLSTQVPTRPIFYTSGSSRRFNLGQMQVLLKHVCPRKLALYGRPAGIALTALWYLGKTVVTVETIEHIGSKLPRSEFEVLCSSTRSMPGWMHDVFVKFKATARHA